MYERVRSLTLAFEKSGDGYVVHASSSAGENVGDASVRIPVAGSPEALGAALFEAVFRGDVAAAYAEAVAMRKDGETVRIGLRFDGCPELEELPWELLADPKRREYVALLPAVLLVRLVTSERAVDEASRAVPIRMLTVLPDEQGWRPSVPVVWYGKSLEAQYVVGIAAALERIAKFRPTVLVLVGTAADDQQLRVVARKTALALIAFHDTTSEIAEAFVTRFYRSFDRSLSEALNEARRASAAISSQTRWSSITITLFEPDADLVSMRSLVARRPPASAARPSKRPKRIDHVEFSVFAPPVVPPRTSFVLTVWAALREPRDPAAPEAPRVDQRSEMLERATAGGRLTEAGSRGPVRIARSSDLVIEIALDGFEVVDPADVLVWEGEVANVSFIVRVPDVTPGTYPGTVRVSRDGLLVARVVFQIVVGATGAEQPAELAASQRLVRSAFASYASADRADVLGRVQGIRAAGVDVFLDVLALRAGSDWERELRREIDERDVLYLFWSAAARASQWVEREWRLALELKGEDFIWPVPLVDPRDVPPPPELGKRHFNDDILAHIRVERERSAYPSEPPPMAAPSPPPPTVARTASAEKLVIEAPHLTIGYSREQSPQPYARATSPSRSFAVLGFVVVSAIVVLLTVLLAWFVISRIGLFWALLVGAALVFGWWLTRARRARHMG